MSGWCQALGDRDRAADPIRVFWGPGGRGSRVVDGEQPAGTGASGGRVSGRVHQPADVDLPGRFLAGLHRSTRLLGMTMRLFLRLPSIQDFREMLFDAAIADAMGEVQITVLAQVLIKKHPLASIISGFAAVAAGGNHPWGFVQRAERFQKMERPFPQIKKRHHLAGEGGHDGYLRL